MSRRRAFAACLALCLVWLPAGAEPLPPMRVQVVTASAWPSIDVDRTRDLFTHVDLGLELPLYRALTMGVRATPAFFYRAGNGHQVFGIGFGLDTSLYFRGSIHTGPYVALGSGPLWTHSNFAGNASRLNLLSRLSVGGKFTRYPFRLAATLEHISNGDTAKPNHGVNGLGVVLGLEL